MKAVNLSIQHGPPILTGTNWLVPAPMREDTTGNAQPLDRAATIRTDRIRVPAPRLELQSGRTGPDDHLVHHLMNLAPDLLSDLKRGRFKTVKEMLEIFVELKQKFSTFEKKFVENDRGLQPFAGHSKGLPFVAEGSQ